MRDEFAEDVKRTVAARVGNVCSNPTCRALTSGPQIDPTRSLNVGVAAHITAASPGGPRHNNNLSSVERRSAHNAIWLCQNCAKLVDNDASRYSESVLRRWKSAAEATAMSAVGKSGALDLRSSNGQIHCLALGERVGIQPTIPRTAERDSYTIQEVGPDYLLVYKEGSQDTVRIPASGTAIVYATEKRVILQLQGRLQWITPPPQRGWVYLPEAPLPGPDGYWGLWKPTSFNDPRVNAMAAGFACRWFRMDAVPESLAKGWHIFYDEDGRYLRVLGRDIDQILMCKCP